MIRNYRTLAAATLTVMLAACTGPAAPAASRTAPQPASITTRVAAASVR